jgi:lysophospholipase L1-like esterase
MAFDADIFEPQRREMRRIFEAEGFAFTAWPGRHIETYTHQKKEVVKSFDGYHWNENGHRVVARALAPALDSLLHLAQARKLPH